MNAGRSPAYAPGTQQTNIYATASLILGILGLFTCVTAPIGLVLGIVALVQIGRDPNQKGSGLAIAGIVTSALTTLMIPVLAAILFPVFARARGQAQASACMDNVRRIGMAMQEYRTDWDEAYPLANSWQEAYEPYIKNAAVWNCPADKSGKPGYAMNAKMSGKPASIMVSPPGTVAFFECVPGKNEAGGPELLPPEPRHMGQHVIGFADGHVGKVEQSAIGNLVWEPVKPGGSAPDNLRRRAY